MVQAVLGWVCVPKVAGVFAVSFSLLASSVLLSFVVSSVWRAFVGEGV